MKQSVRIILCVICGLLIAAAPVLVSSPAMLDEVRSSLMEEISDVELEPEEGDEEEEDDGGETEIRIGRLFFGGALADEAEEIVEEEILEDEDSAADEAETGETGDVSEDGNSSAGAAELPVDFTPGLAPNPAAYTETGYRDDSIEILTEEREEDGVIWHVCRVTIASPTQLRTGIYNPEKPSSNRTDRLSTLAKRYNAVAAINGDYYSKDPAKTTFEIRQKTAIRSKTNRYKDVLIIDENGDFHFIAANPELSSKQYTSWFQEQISAFTAEHQIVNAFTFGPILVWDGQVQTKDFDYGYNPKGKEPRSAIGQTGPLSYVMVVAEGRGESSGCSQQKLAEFMAEIGCLQAFNLDGGNSAEIVCGERMFRGQGGSERPQSDLIYFATTVPEESWK